MKAHIANMLLSIINYQLSIDNYQFFGTNIQQSYMYSRFSLYLLPLALLLGACNNTRHLPEGEVLYTGGKVKLESEDRLPDKGALKGELENTIFPRPNRAILGLRPRLGIHNIAPEPKRDRGFKHWLKYKLGEPPVLLSMTDPERITSVMENRLRNRGYFHEEVEYEIKEKNKRAQVIYTARLRAPYVMQEIHFPEEKDELNSRISQLKHNSLLEQGDPYNLEILRLERIRIDEALKDMGYFHFSPDFLIFQVDTNIGSRQLNVYLRLKEETPREARIIYTINDVYVNPNYSLRRDTAAISADTVPVGNFYFIKQNGQYKPKPLLNSVFIEKGNIYTLKAHQMTLSRIMGLGPFNYVNIRFEDRDTTARRGMLDAFINMSPQKKKSLRFAVQLSTKTNNFAGPGAMASFTNRNAFKGAELLMVNVNGGFETQLGGGQPGLNSYEIGGDMEVQIPRFVTPFMNIRGYNIQQVPRTRIRGGYRLMNRVFFFRMNSFNLSYGYVWRPSITTMHDFNPVSINYIHFGRRQERFVNFLESYPFLRRSYDNQSIIGSTYSFTYNSLLRDKDLIDKPGRSDFYFNGNVDVSGNAMYLIQSVVSESEEDQEGRYTIFGRPFSQYSRFDVDVRGYHNTGSRSKFAGRFIGGIGIPYGNSEALPYVKQFFIGGTQSIRAFRIRSVGPGTYRATDLLPGNFFFDQIGDIKLEGNVEYRFPIFNIIRGAFFLDAGNIWLINEDETRPGGKFFFSEFYKQIAVGTGFGIRLDVTFFVLRLDLGMPLRKPFLPENERWVIRDIDFTDPFWRRDNLILNIAIGYPF